MPLTKKGKARLKDFQRQYGKETGRSYFYAYMKKYPKRTRRWHR